MQVNTGRWNVFTKSFSTDDVLGCQLRSEQFVEESNFHISQVTESESATHGGRLDSLNFRYLVKKPNRMLLLSDGRIGSERKYVAASEMGGPITLFTISRCCHRVSSFSFKYRKLIQMRETVETEMPNRSARSPSNRPSRRQMSVINKTSIGGKD